MENFDWVAARGQCSVAVLFERLKTQIEKDVEGRKALRSGPPFDFGFRHYIEENVIAVVLEGTQLNKSVSFRLKRNAIEVLDTDHNVVLIAKATLNNDGICRLRVDDEELDLWQFRKKALEGLFFIAPDDYMAGASETISRLGGRIVS